MTGPRHLWSGDWERDSVDADATHNHPQPEQDATPQSPEPDPRNGRRPSRTAVAVIVAGALVVAGVAVGLTAAFDGGSSKTGTVSTSTRATGTQSTPGGYGNGYGQIPTAPQTGSTTQPQSQTQTQPSQTQTQQSQTQTTSTIPDLPSINWLGMQIITGPSGPVVTSMALNGAGNAAGFEPDDIISTVNGQSVNSAVAISKLVDKLPLGSAVRLVVVRGSSEISIAVTMKERPTVQP
jgi:membrane-associated protease RseP (regulator of RpoE activity)